MPQSPPSFDAAQLELLERVADGASLPDVLEAIVLIIERHANGMLCSILLLDAGDRTLHRGAAPGLPAEYTEAIDGAAIGPAVGSCGAAAFLRERVVIEDVSTHPNWERYREIALAAGIRASWSTPIWSPQHEVLGTFAMYYRETRGPTPREIEWVAAATHLAAIAIVHARSEKSLSDSEGRSQQLARLYAVSSSVGEALVRIREPQQLYRVACRIAVEQGLATLAWIGSYDTEQDRVVPLVRFGNDDGYVDAIVLRVRDPAVVRGPAALAIDGDAVAVCNDIANDPSFQWKAEALRRGLRSCAVFPLRIGGWAPVVFAIYGDTPGFFRAEEIRVLSALADNIAFAVESAATEAERRRLYDALRESEALLRIAGRSARLGGWSVELPAAELTCSDEVCAIYEVPAGTALTVDQSIGFVAPEFRERARHAFEACAHEGTPIDLELEIVTRSERRVWVRASGRAERGVDGAIVRLQGALQDVDQRRRLEQQLHQAQKMEAIGQLAGGVAHDFNNLLSVILSYASLIVASREPGDPLRADVEQIVEAGERAAELTKQLLTLSRQQRVQARVVDPSRIVLGLEKMLRRVIGENIALVLLTSEQSGNVLADSGQLEQVVMNLVVNARDAMPSGGSLTIETANVDLDESLASTHPVLTAGRYRMIAVNDTGEGMDADTRSHVFEPFFTTKPKGKGTGLGLATVYGIVTQSGGHVVVESELGRGTTVAVYLPRVDAPIEQDEPGEVVRPLELRGSETVLVVEDVEQVRRVICTVLRHAGYDVVEAQNAGEALLVCEQHPSKIDLMLTDVVMPRMSGPELAERIAGLRPQTRVLYMSGYTRSAMPPGGAAAAGIAFLPKPITPEPLLRALRAILDA
jgi:signal transduction histidine kinase